MATNGCACDGCEDHSRHCTCGSASVTDIEDYKTELTTLRARTKELEAKLSELSTTATSKKLRSAQWLNKPDDLAMSVCFSLPAPQYKEIFANAGIGRRFTPIDI